MGHSHHWHPSYTDLKRSFSSFPEVIGTWSQKQLIVAPTAQNYHQYLSNKYKLHNKWDTIDWTAFFKASVSFHAQGLVLVKFLRGWLAVAKITKNWGSHERSTCPFAMKLKTPPICTAVKTKHVHKTSKTPWINSGALALKLRIAWCQCAWSRLMMRGSKAPYIPWLMALRLWFQHNWLSDGPCFCKGRSWRLSANTSVTSWNV